MEEAVQTVAFVELGDMNLRVKQVAILHYLQGKDVFLSLVAKLLLLHIASSI